MKLLHAVFSLTEKRCFQCLTFNYTLALTQLCSGWLILTKIEFEQQVCGVSGYRSISPHIENRHILTYLYIQWHHYLKPYKAIFNISFNPCKNISLPVLGVTSTKVMHYCNLITFFINAVMYCTNFINHITDTIMLLFALQDPL